MLVQQKCWKMLYVVWCGDFWRCCMLYVGVGFSKTLISNVNNVTHHVMRQSLILSTLYCSVFLINFLVCLSEQCHKYRKSQVQIKCLNRLFKAWLVTQMQMQNRKRKIAHIFKCSRNVKSTNCL